MKAVRFLARLFGWLLTPLVAWAASFLGATLTAKLLGASVGDARTQLYFAIAGGGVAALVALFGWLRLLRRSPRLQQTLQVEDVGTPIAAVEPGPAGPGA
jgi:hypothetical protein